MLPIYREFQIFAKPVGALCNLYCSYCYYLDKQNLYKGTDSFIMSDELLEKYIIQHIEATTEPLIFFSWHGGEPTLAGINFYEKVLSFQSKNNPSRKKILNGVQTNGLNLNDEWCTFFAKNNFIVGISIDGPENLNDKFRKTKTGKGSFKSVIESYERLKKYGITPEILCVINSYNVNFPIHIYDFFKSLDVKFITFIPLVEKDSEGFVQKDSVTSESFGQFLITIFNEWVEKDIGKLKIQIFEEAFRTAFNQDHTLCIFKKECGGVPVLEQNGDFYSCDHFVDHKHLIGNINDHHISDMLDSQKQNVFGRAKFNSLPSYCLDCEVLRMCYGECPKNRFILSPTGEKDLNYLCKSYKAFFMHCKPFINAIADEWKKRNAFE